MSSKAYSEKRELPSSVQTPREEAPSLIREDQPQVTRGVGMTGFLVALLGVLLLIAYATRGTILFGNVLFGPGPSIFYTALGLGMMLFHAAHDGDLQVRRTYGVFGFLLLAVALGVTFIPRPNAPSGVHFLPWGFLGFLGALPYLLCFLRHETDKSWRQAGMYTLGACGGVMAAVGLVGSIVSTDFMLPLGLVAGLLGLAYLWAFVGTMGIEDDVAYRSAQGMTVAGLLLMLYAVGASFLPQLWYSMKWTAVAPQPMYFQTAGFLLLGLGFLYVAVSLCLWSDFALVVLFKRELASFFYSPIIYIVMLAFALVASYGYLSFLWGISQMDKRNQPLPEPVVQFFFIDLLTVIPTMFIVPAITMRLLSEEKRSATLEVLLTAPVSEPIVVLAKFLAGLAFFMLLWLPWGLLLLSLRLENSFAFDYRPLLSFTLVLLVTGASFVSMGLFFSSLSPNQIISGILTFVGMVFYLVVYLVLATKLEEESWWRPILMRMSFLHFWISASTGIVAITDLLYPLSATVFWLFATVKVLEARKWL